MSRKQVIVKNTELICYLVVQVLDVCKSWLYYKIQIRKS
jgi:hypothetical protein